MDLTELHAVLSDKKVSDALGINIGTPLLNMEEVDYDIDGNIVFYSSQYFVDGYFEQTVLRKNYSYNVKRVETIISTLFLLYFYCINLEMN